MSDIPKTIAEQIEELTSELEEMWANVPVNPTAADDGDHFPRTEDWNIAQEKQNKIHRKIIDLIGVDITKDTPLGYAEYKAYFITDTNWVYTVWAPNWFPWGFEDHWQKGNEFDLVGHYEIEPVLDPDLEGYKSPEFQKAQQRSYVKYHRLEKLI